jgi:hypothetical protein
MSRPIALMSRFAPAAALALALAAPGLASACACGCGIFDVGANAAFPNQSDSGLTAWFRYSFMNQDKNWEGSSSGPAADNADKQIRTSFYTFGAQYMVNHDWGIMVDIPVFDRSFTTTGDGGPYPAGQPATTKITALGDMVIQAVYAGFSPDMSTGITFGIKLPTGDYTGPYIKPNGLPASDPNSTAGGMAYDRDTLPGTGSTDIVLGGYHVGPLSSDGLVSYFTQVRYEFAIRTRDGATSNAAGADYRPGNELILGAGLAWDLGKFAAWSKVSPVLQVLAARRESDGGAMASLNSGYRRVLLAPGVDLRAGKWRTFLDVEIPVMQNVNTDSPDSGNFGQLVASSQWKVQVSYDF